VGTGVPKQFKLSKEKEADIKRLRLNDLGVKTESQDYIFFVYDNSQTFFLLS
jgi:hypothetical protein